MKASFYRKLQGDFAMIRFLQDPTVFAQTQYDQTVSSLAQARKTINAYSGPDEKRILLYCIDTLFEIIGEGDPQKTYEFADAVHNIPEIYLQKRNLYSFRRELKGFQNKYGKHYFGFIDEVKPQFTKNAPKNKWEYFLPSSDADFKLLHPVGYKWLCVAASAALLLPMILYIAYCLVINPAPNDWPLLLGLVGTFIVGVGFFNIAAAWIHQYMGHLLTAVCLLDGTALTAFSLYWLYA